MDIFNNFIEEKLPIKREDIKVYELAKVSELLAKVSELVEKFKKSESKIYDTNILLDSELLNNESNNSELKNKINNTTHILLVTKETAKIYPYGILMKLNDNFKNYFESDNSEELNKKLITIINNYIDTTLINESFFPSVIVQYNVINRFFLLNLNNFNLSGGNKKTKKSDKYTVKQLKTMAFVYNVNTTKKSNGKIVNLKSNELLTKLKKSKIIL
jgi:hypothetical protein